MMGRRLILKALPAAMAVPVAAHAGDRPDDMTPVERLFWEWVEMQHANSNVSDAGLSIEECDARDDRHAEIEGAIQDRAAALPAQCERDILLKIYMNQGSHHLQFDFDGRFEYLGEEMRSWVGTSDYYAAQKRRSALRWGIGEAPSVVA